MNDKLFEESDVISKYNSEQATKDGFLLDLSVLPLKPKNGIFSHITTTLLSKGYFEENSSIRTINLIDLLNQAVQIIRRAGKQDWFYSGIIELPSGAQQKIFIAQNETGKFTIMLPEDY
jgi:hypothetical protein